MQMLPKLNNCNGSTSEILLPNDRPTPYTPALSTSSPKSMRSLIRSGPKRNETKRNETKSQLSAQTINEWSLGLIAVQGE